MVRPMVHLTQRPTKPLPSVEPGAATSEDLSAYPAIEVTDIETGSSIDLAALVADGDRATPLWFWALIDRRAGPKALALSSLLSRTRQTSRSLAWALKTL
ncbi:MAG: hypothetical protein R2706_10820 [Acidimicrobiales bacterium]